MPFFTLFFLIMPMIEIAVFIAVGQHIGVMSTIGLAFLSAIMGGILIKHQGLTTLLAVHHATRSGKLPLTEIFDGICIVTAGALLITPGFVSDSVGFALLMPPVRALLRRFIREHTNWGMDMSQSRFEGPQRPGPTPPGVIEGEFERVEDDIKD